MNVSLTPQLEQFVRQKVASGLYNSSSEVIREALRLLEERDRVRALRLAALRTDLEVGIEALGRGEGLVFDAEEIIRRGHERLNAQQEEG